MRVRVAHAATLLLVLAQSSGRAENAGWQKTAASDIVAMRSILRENSPAVYVDKDSQLFRQWLGRGFAEAQHDLPKVTDGRSYYYLLKGYAGGFRDSHITVSVNAGTSLRGNVASWPGFATSWRRGAYRVAYIDPARTSELPPVGAILAECDGQPIESLARSRLDRYEGDLNLEGGRYFSAPKLLWGMGNPFVGPLPNHCTFQVRGVGHREFALSYAPIAPDLADRAIRAAAGAAKPRLTIERWLNDRWWIGLPSMLEGQDWLKFFQDLDRHQEEIRSAPVVVIDVRGNKGGDTAYPERMASMLWGDALVRAFGPDRGDETYRVSKLNRSFFADSLREFAAKGEVNEYVEPFANLLERMDRASARGIPLVTMPNPPPERPDKEPPNPMKGVVLVLTDYVCNSACLDMLDLYLRFPNAIQAGVSTSADTIFMEVSSQGLPSGSARLSYGHKAWVMRPRGTNVPYVPSGAFTYLGDLGDDDAMRAWVSGLPLVSCARSAVRAP